MDHTIVSKALRHGRESQNQNQFSDSIKGDLFTGDRRRE